MRSRTVRMVIPAAVLAASALALTGCQSNKTSDASASTTTTPTSAPTTPAAVGGTTPSDSAATSPTATATATSGGGSTTNKAAPAAAGQACTSGQLTVSLSGQSVGAGQYYAKVVFTNTASSSCLLLGYPGVSYVKSAGVQVGNPAARTGQTYHTVTLAAHGHASAVLHDSDGLGGYSKGQCQLTAVQGLRIYPPNQKAALFLPDKTEHCAGTGIHPLTIGPVQS